jgi:hypothetical protein
VKKIFVDPFTFEVARTLHRHLSERIGDDISQMEQRALVAIIFALNDSGFLISEHLRRETWFCFGPEAKDLDQLGDVPDERLKELIAHTILFKLKRSELSRSLELSERFRADLDLDVVKSSWRGVGAIIDRILKGDLRLIGPEVDDGLIVQDLTRSTPKRKALRVVLVRQDKQGTVSGGPRKSRVLRGTTTSNAPKSRSCSIGARTKICNLGRSDGSRMMTAFIFDLPWMNCDDPSTADLL